MTATVTNSRSDSGYRAGFACFVGRPNAGKSTLANAIVGSKIAITSSRPQTTRHVVRGVLHRPDSQLILVDTPGMHKPRTLLGERLNDLVRQTWSEVDVIGLCIPADEKVGPGDRFIQGQLARPKGGGPEAQRTGKGAAGGPEAQRTGNVSGGGPKGEGGGRGQPTVIAVVTKIDLVTKARLAEQLLAVSRLGEFAEVVPCSAVSGEQVGLLVDVMSSYLPFSPQLYPDDMITDEPEQVMIAELIREAALEGVRDELPHSIAVVVEELQRRPADEGPPLTRIYADLYVERPSQKAIVLGHRASRIKQVGITARRQIEELLDTRVYLDLHVRVAKEWQRDPKQLRKLGF